MFSRKQLEHMVESLLATEPVVTPARIRELILNLRQVAPISEDEAEMLARDFEARHGVTMTLGEVLRDEDFQPWLPKAKETIDFFFWTRYRKLLEQKHFSKRVIDTIHQDTDRTLEFLQNPNLEGPWRRRGMVMGHVQSGKTANYLGLIAKAADAGYKIIVVIAGIHDNLRNQTQRRIDEGFVGRDSARERNRNEDTRLGVGLFDNSRRPVTFTSSLRDFNTATANAVGVPLQGLKEPAILVIKKNPKTLESLINWIRHLNTNAAGQTLVDSPLLLIDDEADNASINVAKGEAISTINGQIRKLLNLFSRSCYVGYTATPFANIFIDPNSRSEMLGEDLFPRHFIVSLDPPSNYFGANRVFIEESERFLRRLDDYEETLPISHKQHHQVDELPDSLLAAIRSFIIARAIRLLRGHQTAHCSMLINVSRFTAVQSQVKAAVKRVLEPIQESVKLQAGLPAARALRDPEMGALKEVLDTEFSEVGVAWEQVQGVLIEAAVPIKVVEVNNRSADSLNYAGYASTGLSVIAVGGYSLSRGLTLEGLMISYYLRNSQMYDTLMQMARWFGYRDGYDDLCRVWMPEEASSWYAHIAESIEELREELRKMAAAGATPAEFGLKVRAHPDTLRVTAANKMGSGEKRVFSIGLSGQLAETYKVRADDQSLTANLSAAKTLFAALNSLGCSFENLEHNRLFSDVPADLVLAFIRSYRNHPGCLITEPDPITRYIEKRKANELGVWDVVITGVAPRYSEPDHPFGFGGDRPYRTAGQTTDGKRTLLLSNNRRVASVGAERFGLTPDEIALVKETFYREAHEKGRSPKTVPDRAYRLIRKKPLLMLHVFRVAKSQFIREEQPVVAYSLSFPVTEQDEQRVEYVVTKGWLDEHAVVEADEEMLLEEATA